MGCYRFKLEFFTGVCADTPSPLRGEGRGEGRSPADEPALGPELDVTYEEGDIDAFLEKILDATSGSLRS